MKPRLLLVPSLTEMEWPIRPLIESWAEVGSYDAPGVGDEPPPAQFTSDAIAARGLQELDRLGWDRVVLVADEFGTAVASRIAASRPEAIEAIALGHPCLAYGTGDDASSGLNVEVMKGMASLLNSDYRTFVRHLSQITQGAYDDEFADRYYERVPREVALAYLNFNFGERVECGLLLQGLDIPMLLVRHDGCIGWTDEGYEEMVRAFPHAETATTDEKPSVSEAFAERLRTFCLEHAAVGQTG